MLSKRKLALIDTQSTTIFLWFWFNTVSTIKGIHSQVRMSNAFESNAYGQNYATGGGFMSGGGGSQGTQGAGGRGGGSDKQTLRALTVRQINDAAQAHTDAEFIIDGQATTQLTFVGIVRQITVNATNIIYQIDDGSGTMEVRVWLDQADGPGEKYKDIVEWTYVRVIGQIKSFQSRRYVTGGFLRRISDPNEIFYHKLEVIHTHLLLSKASGNGAKLANGTGGGDDDRMMLDDRKFDDLENPIDRKIMQAVEALAHAGNEGGVPISALARRIPGTGEEKVRERIESLISEGYMYTAEDDEHVLSTMST